MPRGPTPGIGRDGSNRLLGREVYYPPGEAEVTHGGGTAQLEGRMR